MLQIQGLPWWLSCKESGCNAEAAGEMGSVPKLGSSPGGHGNPLQYCSLENPMDSGAWWASVHGIAKSWTRLKRLSACMYTHTHTLRTEIFPF